MLEVISVSFKNKNYPLPYFSTSPDLIYKKVVSLFGVESVWPVSCQLFIQVITLNKQHSFLFFPDRRRRWLTLLLICRVTGQSSVYLRLWGKPLCKYLSLQPAVLWDRIFLYILLNVREKLSALHIPELHQLHGSGPHDKYILKHSYFSRKCAAVPENCRMESQGWRLRLEVRFWFIWFWATTSSSSSFHNSWCSG